MARLGGGDPMEWRVPVGLRYLRRELASHLPFSIFATLGGMVLVALLTFARVPFYKDELPHAMEDLFHVFHPAHMLLSATATTAMFWRHERRFLKAFVVGLVGAIGVCGTSDILMPYLSGLVLGAPMELHICIIHHPLLVVPFAFVGTLTGFLAADHIGRSTFFSHGAHVLVSSAASLLYLVSFGLSHWAHQAGAVFVFVLLAVTVPCCFSDIVFPLLAVTRGSPPPCQSEQGPAGHDHP
jgi:hypothetical protein